jgi:hypothetical protein
MLHSQLQRWSVECGVNLQLKHVLLLLLLIALLQQ